jgi:WD40 repeat protein
MTESPSWIFISNSIHFGGKKENRQPFYQAGARNPSILGYLPIIPPKFKEQEAWDKHFIIVSCWKYQPATAEREKVMKQRKWLLLILIFLLSASLLAACSFSVKVLPTPAVFSPAQTSLSPTATQTSASSTTVLPSAMPTLISIRADTISMLEVFESLEMGDIVRSLTFTPDGTVLAAAGGNSDDFSIHLWEVTSGQSRGTLEGHTGIIWGVAFSPDGQLLASVSSDRTAKIWDWRKGTLLKSLDFPGEASSVSFSPDGQTLAVGGVDELKNQIQNAAIWTYSVDSWKPLLKLPEYLNIAAMAYSPDGRWLIGGGTSRNVQVWQASDGALLLTFNHAHQVSKIAVSPDSSTVAAATCESPLNNLCMEGGVWLWDLRTGRLIQKLKDFPDVVDSVAFSLDGSSLIAASRDGTLRVYSTADDQPRFEARSVGGIEALALSSDSGMLATGSTNGEIQLWKIVYRP